MLAASEIVRPFLVGVPIRRPFVGRGHVLEGAPDDSATYSGFRLHRFRCSPFRNIIVEFFGAHA
jgi:hypothetical protein